MDVEERPSKKDAFLTFLKEGWVWVHLDARRAGVDLPPELAENPRLVLQYGYNMPIPIPDLRVDEFGVRATLSFSRLLHQTFIPWAAVYIVSCTDGRGVVYFEDVPDEVALLGAPVAAGGDRPGAAGGEKNGGGRAAEPRDPKDVPPMREAVGQSSGEPGAPEGVVERRDSRPVLAVVPPGPDDDLEESEPSAASARRRRPRLRLVK